MLWHFGWYIPSVLAIPGTIPFILFGTCHKGITVISNPKNKELLVASSIILTFPSGNSLEYLDKVPCFLMHVAHFQITLYIWPSISLAIDI